MQHREEQLKLGHMFNINCCFSDYQGSQISTAHTQYFHHAAHCSAPQAAAGIGNKAHTSHFTVQMRVLYCSGLRCILNVAVGKLQLERICKICMISIICSATVSFSFMFTSSLAQKIGFYMSQKFSAHRVNQFLLSFTSSLLFSPTKQHSSYIFHEIQRSSDNTGLT